MAMVKFWRGASAPVTRDDDTLYFDKSGKIYLGETLIADVTVLDTETVNSLVAQALNQYYTKTEIDGFITTISNNFNDYRTSAAQDIIDNEIKASVKAISDDYLKAADKTELEGKITAHETAVNTKFNDYNTKEAQKAIDDAQDKALTDYKAEMVETLKGYQTTIPAETYDAYGSAATAEQNAKDYTDEEITGLEFALSEDGKTLELKNKAGTAVAELDTTKFVKDGMISSVAISEDGAKLVITWNTDAGISATEIPLTELVDVMTGVDGTTITVNVSADDKISAEVKAGSITTSHIAANAGIVKTQLHSDVQASLGKADTALQEHQDISGKLDIGSTSDIPGANTYYGLSSLMRYEIETGVADDFRELKEELAKEDSSIVVGKALSAEKDDLGNSIKDTYLNKTDFASNDIFNVKLNTNQTIIGVKTFQDFQNANLKTIVSGSEVKVTNSDAQNVSIKEGSVSASHYLKVGPAADNISIDMDSITVKRLADTDPNGARFTFKTEGGVLETETGAQAKADAAAKAVQGNTNATVENCVNAINALNAGQMEATNGINAINTSVADIITMLTWIEG